MNGEPLKLIRDEGNAILTSEEVWNGMTKTLNLASIPGMLKSVRSGMREQIACTTTDLDWQ